MTGEGLLNLNERIKSEAAELWPGKRLVFGEGGINSAVVMIGEAPGGDEEREGRPFVGKAGKNLSEFLRAANLCREDIYITNVVKLRPSCPSPKTGREINRQPNAEEKNFFIPFLFEEIRIISPRLIVTLGNIALKAVLGEESPGVGCLHGKVIPFGDFKVFPLYHPAAVIYNQSLKSVYNDDILAAGAYIRGDRPSS